VRKVKILTRGPDILQQARGIFGLVVFFFAGYVFNFPHGKLLGKKVCCNRRVAVVGAV